MGIFVIFLIFMLTSYTGFAVKEGTLGKETLNFENKSKGLVSFTFDDGLLTFYTRVYPSMKTYGINGTVYVIANLTDSREKFEGRELMTFENLREMQANGWEIGSHSLNHINVVKTSDAQLEEELSISKKILEKNGLHIRGIAFPYGFFDDRTVLGASKYYDTVRPLFLGYNERNNTDWLRLRSRWVMKDNYNGDVCSWIAYAKEKDYWLILTFHNVDFNKTTQWDTSLYDFNEILRCTVEMDVPVKTLREIAREYKILNSTLTN